MEVGVLYSGVSNRIVEMEEDGLGSGERGAGSGTDAVEGGKGLPKAEVELTGCYGRL